MIINSRFSGGPTSDADQERPQRRRPCWDQEWVAWKSQRFDLGHADVDNVYLEAEWSQDGQTKQSDVKNILSVWLVLLVKVGSFDEFVGYRQALNALIEGFLGEFLDWELLWAAESALFKWASANVENAFSNLQTLLERSSLPAWPSVPAWRP